MKTRYCPECGRSVPLDARICPYCTKTIPMHEAQIVTQPDEKKDNTGKILLMVVAIIVIMVVVTVAIAATVYVYVSGMNSARNWESSPIVYFTKNDQSTTNSITIISADPINIDWSDIELQVDGMEQNHGMSGIVTVGDRIDISNIAGNGEYTISFRYVPSNTLLGSFDFTGEI